MCSVRLSKLYNIFLKGCLKRELLINSEGYFGSNLAFLAQLISTLRKSIPQKNREADPFETASFNVDIFDNVYHIAHFKNIRNLRFTTIVLQIYQYLLLGF